MSACIDSFTGAACSALGGIHGSPILAANLRYVVYPDNEWRAYASETFQKQSPA